MTKKANLNTIANSTNSISAINDELEKLNNQFENTVSRDGSTPNNMEADLDMDGNDIINADNITASGSLTINGKVINPSPTALDSTAVKVSYESNDDTNAFTDDDLKGLRFNKFTDRNAINAANAVNNLPDLSLFYMENLLYKTDATAIGVLSATNDLGVDGIIPLGDYILDRHFGVAGDGVTDDSSKLQSMIDFCGTNKKFFIITKRCSLSTTLLINSHGLKGSFLGDGQIVWRGSGAAVDSSYIGSSYPVSCDLSFNIELTLSGQYGWDYKFSYSKGRVLLDMNDASCTSCIGVRAMGDATNGTGSYYNTLAIRGQGGHLSNSILLQTMPSDGDFTSNRGPNACRFIIERAGQFNTAIYDRVGAGNSFEIQACEASAVASTICVLAGHQTSASYLVNNRYDVQYTENVDTVFKTNVGVYGAGLDLVHTFATGGQDIEDNSGLLRSSEGIGGFSRLVTANAPAIFNINSTGTALQINKSGSPSLDLYDTSTSNYLRMTTSHSFSYGTHALRFFLGGTEMFRIGTTRVSPVTDNTKSLGAAAERLTTVYAATGTINTSDEREKQDIEVIPDEWLDAWGDVEWCRYKWRDGGKRWHTGLIAQRIEKAFADRGLDAFECGVLCFDKWEDQIGPDGELEAPAGDRYGVRYEEAFALEAAYQRREIQRLKGE